MNKIEWLKNIWVVSFYNIFIKIKSIFMLKPVTKIKQEYLPFVSLGLEAFELSYGGLMFL